MTLDVQKAAQIMREAGLEVQHGVGWVTGYALEGDHVVMAREPYRVLTGDPLTTGRIDDQVRTADEMGALAARLVWTAALCRRIDAECRTPATAPAPERQCARDVTFTWAPGPGAPLGPRGVVPGDPSTYPAEGEPLHDTEGRP